MAPRPSLATALCLSTEWPSRKSRISTPRASLELFSAGDARSRSGGGLAALAPWLTPEGHRTRCRRPYLAGTSESGVFAGWRPPWRRRRGAVFQLRRSFRAALRTGQSQAPPEAASRCHRTRTRGVPRGGSLGRSGGAIA
eukprot:scaffold1726_cov260-Pinguiococcus_pyrenoidosus.AAC.3